MSLLGASASTSAPASSSSLFTFARSDGDPEQTSIKQLNMDPTPDASKFVNFHVRIAVGSKQDEAMRAKIGAGIAELMGKGDTKRTKYTIANWPEHYLFLEHNKGTLGNVRKDRYIYGSKNVKQFRSALEIIPHLYWLLTDESLHHASNCKCQYAGKYSRGGKSNTAASTAAPFKKRKRRASGCSEPEQEIARGRDGDVRLTRRYRDGEVVWAAVKPIQGENGQIYFWPARVLGTEFKVHTTPATETEPFMTVQHYVYDVKLLATGSIAKRLQTELIPTLAYNPSPDLFEIVPFSFPRDLVMPPYFAPSAPSTAFPQLDSLSLEAAITPYAYALQVSATLQQTWTLTDKYIVAGGKGDGYQGVWLGAERIWVGDLVRLKRGREALAPGVDLPAPRHGAEARTLFLKIARILRVALKSDSGSNAAVDGAAEAQCRVRGDLYELVPSSSEVVPPPPAHAGAAPLPPPPPDLAFSLVNKPATSVEFNFQEVAGRYYPGLVGHVELDKPISPVLQRDAEADAEANEKASQHMHALCGVAPAHDGVTMQAIEWFGARSAALEHSQSQAGEAMRNLWASHKEAYELGDNAEDESVEALIL